MEPVGPVGPVGKVNGEIGGNVGPNKFRSNATPLKKTFFSFMYTLTSLRCLYLS